MSGGVGMPSEKIPERVHEVVLHVLAHPWDVFVLRWNWKAAVLSALFGGGAFALALGRLAGGALDTVLVEMAFRVAVGGCWGSLLQSFRNAQPGWLANLVAAVGLPAVMHALEFALLRGLHATHVRTGMIVSIAISIGSLLVNLGLMRRGLLITGAGATSLASDLRRLPAALADMCRGLVRTV